MEYRWLPVIVAAVAQMVLGFIWYGPLFGKTWAGLMKMDTTQADRSALTRIYAWSFVGSLVTAFVLDQFVRWTGATTAAAGATIGFWAWLGFVATVTAASVLYERRPTALYLLNNGYQLASLLVMGAILGAWT
ncbi:MAG TPA: DUF1761 domain-containing protein [bacterium]|jgi:hypothetical protein|nr:DUF1761 domain-containing protein [bacterium]